MSVLPPTSAIAGQEPTALVAAWRALLRFLRRPAVVVTEVVAFGATAALAASLPQQPDTEEVRRLVERSRVFGKLVALLGLDEIVTSAWFLVVTALCILSLVAVQAQQWPRLKRIWAAGLDATSFARAPFRRTAPLATARGGARAPRFSSTGRLGLLGSPVFHAGLLLLGIAGLVRLLTFRDVVGRVLEGEPFGGGAFEAERGGRLSSPFALPGTVRLEEVVEERYGSGALLQVGVKLSVEREGRAPERHTAAINSPFDLGDARIYVTNAHGVATLFRASGPAGELPLAAFLEERNREWRGGLRPAEGLELRLRSTSLARPQSIELRVLRDGVLLGVAELAPGATMKVAGWGSVELVGLPFWVRLRGSSDPSKPLFFAGVVVGILGIVLMFSFNRVDTGVFVEDDRLVVAMRPQRFAPLYGERFERLCKEWLA